MAAVTILYYAIPESDFADNASLALILKQCDEQIAGSEIFGLETTFIPTTVALKSVVLQFQCAMLL